MALDTNALLLPYQLGKSDLAGLATVYAKLARESRLFLPEQVAREFIKNRDRKLADMVQAFEDRTSRLSGWDVNVSPLLLEGFADREALMKAAAAHEEAAKAYLSQLRALAKQMKAWRGDDPVSAIYAATFGKEHLIGPGVPNEKVIEELHYGLLHQVPPGYKDASKDDQGIGDVIVWLSLLDLGKTSGKDLVFVTGEQKADWFVRAGKQPLYPRPELVDAYRRASGGRSLRLSSLHDLLRDLKAPDSLVADVQIAEASANNAIQAEAAGNLRFADTMRTSWRSSELRFYGGGPAVPAGEKVFDYSTYDGRVRIEHAAKLSMSRSPIERFLRSGADRDLWSGLARRSRGRARPFRRRRFLVQARRRAVDPPPPERAGCERPRHRLCLPGLPHRRNDAELLRAARRVALPRREGARSGHLWEIQLQSGGS